MKLIRNILIVLVVLFIVGAVFGSPGEDKAYSSNDAQQDEATLDNQQDATEPEATEQESAPKEPETVANLSNADFDITFARVSDSGIDVTLYSNNGNIMVMPSWFEVAGEKIPMFEDGNNNPRVHISAGEATDLSWIDLMNEESQNVHIVIDGVSDYSSFVMHFDESITTDSSTKVYEILDCSLTVTQR